MDTQKHKLAHRIEIEVWQSDPQAEAEDQSHSNAHRNECLKCGKTAPTFDDEYNRMEFQKSGLCHECQDNKVIRFKQP